MTATRIVRWSRKTATAAASSTLQFSQNDIPTPRQGFSLVGLLIEHQSGTGNDISAVDEIRVFASGNTILKLSGIQLRSFLEVVSRRDGDPGATATAYRVPLNLADEDDEEAQDRCAFPLGLQPVIEIDLDATVAVSGTIRLGFIYSDVPPVLAPMLYSQPMNVSASVANQIVQITERGLIRAIGLNGLGTNGGANGITRHKVTLANDLRIEGSPGMLDAYQEAVFGPQTVTDGTYGAPIWVKLVGMPQGGDGTNEIEVDTGSGNTTADEVVLWALRGQRAG